MHVCWSGICRYLIQVLQRLLVSLTVFLTRIPWVYQILIRDCIPLWILDWKVTALSEIIVGSQMKLQLLLFHWILDCFFSRCNSKCWVELLNIAPSRLELPRVVFQLFREITRAGFLLSRHPRPLLLYLILQYSYLTYIHIKTWRVWAKTMPHIDQVLWYTLFHHFQSSCFYFSALAYLF